MRLKGPKLEAEWRLFCERLAAIFPIPLPNRLGEARFFYFDAAFTPVAVFGNEYALWSRQGDAMRTLLLAKGLAKPKPIYGLGVQLAEASSSYSDLLQVFWLN